MLEPQMSDAERSYLERHGAAKHAQRAQLIAVIERHYRRRCIGACDENQFCSRHSRSEEVATRYLRRYAERL